MPHGSQPGEALAEDVVADVLLAADPVSTQAVRTRNSESVNAGRELWQTNWKRGSDLEHAARQLGEVMAARRQSG